LPSAAALYALLTTANSTLFPQAVDKRIPPLARLLRQCPHPAAARRKKKDPAPPSGGTGSAVEL